MRDGRNAPHYHPPKMPRQGFRFVGVSTVALVFGEPQ